MFGILKLVFRAFRSERRPQRPRPSALISVDRQTAVKTKALSAADVSVRLESLPQAKVMRVLDGDTLIVAKGWGQTPIRLDSIDCPEDGQPWGNIAKAGLIKLVGGRRIEMGDSIPIPGGT